MDVECIKIISGGQTGADRAALDAALAAGVPCGGWCPEGRLAEDGPIADRYPLRELPGAGYPQRTRQSVVDSDGTLVVSFGPPDEGTALTIRCCHDASKPILVVDANVTPVVSVVPEVIGFVRRHGIKTLNVAGPRASTQPQIYDYVLKLIRGLLTAVTSGGAKTCSGARGARLVCGRTS